MIELSYPAKALWPNFRSRSHWPKTRALAAARKEGFYATKAAKVGIIAGELPIHLRITLHPLNSRPQCQPDKDNIVSALKGYLDGIADALSVNDRSFVPLPPVIADPVKGGKITVEVV